MASKNQVTLTFAGDSAQLEKSFDRVGSSSKAMGDDVGKASKQVRDIRPGFDVAGDAADRLDTKAMGFRDTMTGVEDTGMGLAKVMKGDLFDGFLTLGMGVGDLASGMFNFLIPTMKQLSIASFAQAKAFAAAKIQQAAMTAGTIVGTIAGKAARLAITVWTAAQWALNAAMRANPIGIVITAITLLVGAFVLAWKRSETFRRIVTGALNGVKAVASAVWSALTAGARKVGSVFGAVGRALAAPFRTAFQGIRNVWNSTIGGRGFTTPEWLPFGLGGRSFRIPRLHQGGTMPGAPGTEGLALLQAGERVSRAGAAATTVIEFRSDGSKMADMFLEMMRKSVRVQGGNVQVVLGS